MTAINLVGVEEWAATVAALRTYLDGIEIYSHNIGNIRRTLCMPFPCPWNGVVRDETARRENKHLIPTERDQS